MRLAAIYDIHGNLPALEAVLEDISKQGADMIVVGGDVVAGPMPRQTLNLLLEQTTPVQFIRGNADREIVEQMSGKHDSELPEAVGEVVRWVAQQLEPEHARLMAAWPETLSLRIGGLGAVLFCHATPRNDTEIFTRITPKERLLPVFRDVQESLVVCGHTHMQFDRRVGGLRVVNAGSVGMPYGEGGAYWLMLGPGLEFKRTSFDQAKAAERMRVTGYPNVESFVLENVLLTPTESEALSVFEPMAIGTNQS